MGGQTAERTQDTHGRGFPLQLLDDQRVGHARQLDLVGVCVGELATNAPLHGVPPGRGLLLVAALADRWGVGERDPGKVVRCEFGRVADGCLDGSPGRQLTHGVF
ncbi:MULTISPECIES: hypothetical protein [Streptomyces]|uniref:PPM-type phosphatase domain-containing protein n=2 Tax=Streptomyces TaxID=1883 RepID=A0ABV9IVJ4_9ACTN